jgi:hypothetical protein
MKGIAWVKPVSREQHGEVVERVARFCPTVKPPSFAKGITPEMTQWLERSRWDLRTHVCSYVIEANIPDDWKKYFSSSGVYRLEARGEQSTARVVEGSMEIRVAIVGAIAERFIVSTLKEQFAAEARLLTERAREMRTAGAT